MARAIGIDLGTSYTVVATIEGGRPRVIPNAEGQHLTPSVVSFGTGGELLVGDGAKRGAVANPNHTVFSIKRRMGSDYTVSAGGKRYTPQEISSFVLRKVKADAEEYLGERIDQAVITVPAYFNDRQRQATRQAGLLAGLDVMRIINEPTAAALAYGLLREEAHTVLVWDLGGGTFDVSILELGEGIFEVRAVSGDTWLGGDDYDKRVMDYLADEHRKATGNDLPDDSEVRQRLKEEAERTKIRLSSSHVARAIIPGAAAPGSPPLEVELTREHLEGLCVDLLDRMAAPTLQALKDAGLSPEDLDRVILVGGATRMPAVRELARKLIGIEPYRYIDPDEVVAMGAAIQAGMVLGLIDKAVLLDVLPLSLGIETQGGLMATIIPRNTALPASGSRIFTTAADYQTSMDIHMLQGERALAVDNISLEQFELTGIPAAFKGVAKAEVAFEADVDGIVHVSASDLLSESEVKVKVSSTKLRDAQEIDELAADGRAKYEEDQKRRDRIQAGIEAENLLDAAEKVLKGPQGDIQLKRLVDAISRTREALGGEITEEIRLSCRDLLRLLQAIDKASPRAAAPN